MRAPDSLKEGAELSNVYGKAAVMTKQDLIDFTVVHPASIVAYTSQFSDSTAENADGAAVNIIDGNEKTYWQFSLQQFTGYAAGDYL